MLKAHQKADRRLVFKAMSGGMARRLQADLVELFQAL